LKEEREQVLTNRPAVIANVMRPNDIQDGEPNEALVTVVNFGRTLALNVIVPGEVVTAHSYETEPSDPRCSEYGRPPKDLYKTALAQVDAIPNHPSSYEAEWKLAPYTRNAEQGDIIYAVGCVYYEGLDGSLYYSDICNKWDGHGFVACVNTERNYVR
jgi:hypothetical protein